MYEEEYILTTLVYLALGYICFSYADGFLTKNYERRTFALTVWLAVYTASQFMLQEIFSTAPLYEHFARILLHALPIFALQRCFFAKDTPRQTFVVVSFVAGWEILRFFASPAAHAILGIWGNILTWFVTQGVASFPEYANDIIRAMPTVNRGAVVLALVICRAVQIGLFAAYLRLIRQNFTHLEYRCLTGKAALFLLLPCITVLIMDMTLRRMVLPANGAAVLIYESAPETVLLLPIVSLLLLGSVVSSVILFQNLIQYKDEEQKRLLLENSVGQINREIAEISDIYADIRGLRHDLRNHLANIKAYINRNWSANDAELADYLNGMETTVSRLDFQDRTGNPITDVIICQARLRAKKQNAEFNADFYFPSGWQIDVYDLSVILNNALQNALDACEKLAPPKSIDVRSYTKGNLFFLEVENDFSGTLRQKQGSDLPDTDKSNTELHGLGLTNIRRCAQKYRGDLDIEIITSPTGQRFCLTVMLATEKQ